MSTPAQPATILDRSRSIFPLDLDVRVPKVRDLFHMAAAKQWDPATDVDWSAFDASRYSEEQRYAARQYWSRRAWSEYGAISESPALQLRFCSDPCPPDLQLYFTIRSQEESRHAEACYRMAEALGGYIEAPVQAAFQGSVATHGVRKMALDPDTSIEATLAALVCAAEEIAFDVFRHLTQITRDPVANQICTLIMRDEVRHCALGWRYLDHRVPSMTRDELQQAEDAVINMMEKVELNGYHSAWLAPDNPASRAEVEVDRITWEAGLGATTEELEKPVFVASVQRIRRQMQDWGINLPTFRHPKIGEF
ncbi:ferritin-like domain-containing protein [Verticiella sediminum]|uniref:Ferritin-like domain-containing protein n=1 Tax=Verticiella sediminum TaxID=1247510 RepID=A0A556B230_9BURK|nr:ferritin-like domain-containing protein [Verticiella sediminum]TSH99213.1 ferritin-like domain-containing protein [Verticiella sediminum]